MLKKTLIVGLLALLASAGCSHSGTTAKPTRTDCPSCNAPTAQSAPAPLLDLRKYEQPGCKNGKCPIPKGKYNDI